MTTTSPMQFEAHEIHIWTRDLAITLEQEKAAWVLLSEDEQQRANRFHFPIHRQRFIASRSMLRTILSLYLDYSSKNIIFGYGEHKKPYLHTPNQSQIQFNLAHSDNMAIYALTLNYAVGIDIEKIKPSDYQAIAKRYFSSPENEALMALPIDKQLQGFYRIWSRKEALIKASGKGLSLPLSTFSVSIYNDFETIQLENKTWSLLSIPIFPDYQTAIASNQPIKAVSYWHFFNHSPQLDKRVRWE